VLLTRAPLYSPLQAEAFSYDLHVLSTPPAFTLSQDQTLQLNLCLAAVAANKQGSQLKASSLFSFQRSNSMRLPAVKTIFIIFPAFSCQALFSLFFLSGALPMQRSRTLYIFRSALSTTFFGFPKEFFQERLFKYHTIQQQVNDISNDHFARELHDPSKR
jgi:hypothetical protein